jgi:hypothetical protein
MILLYFIMAAVSLQPVCSFDGLSEPHRLIKPCWPAHLRLRELWWTLPGTSKCELTMRIVEGRELFLVDVFGDSGAGEGDGVGCWILMVGVMRDLAGSGKAGRGSAASSGVVLDLSLGSVVFVTSSWLASGVEQLVVIGQHSQLSMVERDSPLVKDSTLDMTSVVWQTESPSVSETSRRGLMLLRLILRIFSGWIMNSPTIWPWDRDDCTLLALFGMAGNGRPDEMMPLAT